MQRVRLIHWNAGESRQRAAGLRAAGYQVLARQVDAGFMKSLRASPPAAVVVDLGRMPAQGRDVGMMIRNSKSTRHLPLVFVNGDPDKAAAIRKQLPDAVYTTWGRIGASLQRAIARPPDRPVAPASALAGYSGTPLPKKLGIKGGSTVALVEAPEGFERTLGAIPPGAVLRRGARGKVDLTIWFVRSKRDLSRRLAGVIRRMGPGGLWIAWPKKTSPLAGDLSQNDVRRSGLDAGLVDYKIAAIDGDWSGLKFSVRRKL